MMQKFLDKVRKFFFRPEIEAGEYDVLKAKIIPPFINLSLGIIAFYLIFFIFLAIFGIRQLSLMYFFLFLLFLGFFLLRILYLHSSEIKFSSIGVILLTWLGIMVGFLFFENGLRAPAFSALLIVLIAYTALLHGSKTAIVFAALTLVVNLLVIFLESKGLYLSPPRTPNVWYAWIGQMLSLGGIIYVIDLILVNLNKIIFRSKREAGLRQEAEEKMRRINYDLEQRVAERTAELQNSYKSMEEFSYTIAHDLRAPLRAMAGFSQILHMDLVEQLDEEYTDYLQRIVTTAISMDEMINGLLHLAAISQQEFNAEQINLSPIVREILDNLQVAQPHRWVNVRIMEGGLVWGDESLFRVLLHQLLHNAWKFTSIREIGEIEFSWVDREEGRVFVVRDNGIGFNPEFMQTVFNPFQTLHEEQGLEGLGLGLTTVQRIVSRHGGRIWAKSKEGEGSTFYFSLPKVE